MLATSAAAPAAWTSPRLEETVLERHAELVVRLLGRQITDPNSRWCGGYADEFGIHYPSSAAGILEIFTAAFLHSGSKFHRDPLLVQRMRLAAKYLERAQSADGFIDLPSTNFNSPPDTAFVVQPVARAACLAARHGEQEIARLVEGFLRRAAGGLSRGGIHTPNHRWVVCSALAQLYELYGDPACLRRIEQWLAEGIDIDEDGQYTERSTVVYNAVTNHALLVMAHKLKRFELLEPVRRNLNSMLYLLHPNGEVVTEISRRQDRYQRGDMGSYWFSLQYMAVHDQDGRFATLARSLAPRHAALGALMEYPELLRPLPPDAPLPEDYEKQFPALGIARIRRGPTSATLVLGGDSRFFTLRRGEAVVQAVRFASAFFGKGQFVPQQAVRRSDGYWFSQNLEASYYQPLDPPRRISPDEWSKARMQRRQSEICRLTQEAIVTESADGFRVRIRAYGTDHVPVAVEISFAEGGTLEGVQPAPKADGAWLFAGSWATYRRGGDMIRFGPGLREHSYTQVRLAEPKIPGPSVYLTTYTPVDHTIEFRWS